MSLRYSLIFFLLVGAKTLFAQQPANTSSRFGVALGYENVRTLDLNASPLVYSANNGVLTLGYGKNTEKVIWSIQTQLSIGSNQSKLHGIRNAAYPGKPDLFGNVDTTFYELNPIISFMSWSVDFSKFWKINSHWFFGGEIGNGHYYGAIGADSWFFNAAGIRPGVLGKFGLGNKSQVSIQLSSALVSYIVRQPYTLDPSLPIPNFQWANIKTGSSIATLNSFQNINFKASYLKDLGNTRAVGFTYQFQWMNHAQIENRNLKKYSNSIALQYNF